MPEPKLGCQCSHMASSSSCIATGTTGWRLGTLHAAPQERLSAAGISTPTCMQACFLLSVRPALCAQLQRMHCSWLELLALQLPALADLVPPRLPVLQRL